MNKIKRGDIVGRISYGKDIIFEVQTIIKTSSNEEIAILKGLLIRISVNSPISDLEKIEKNVVVEKIKKFNNLIDKEIEQYSKVVDNVSKQEDVVQCGKRSSRIIQTGKILHLDGDKRYSEKSQRYYKGIGLNAIVRNIPENRQAKMVGVLLEKYQPNILIITGHDGMLKKGSNFNDLNNYRNSMHFVNAVKEARRWEKKSKDLVIFAGACQSFFEAIMLAGANFASSPARILIDFMDPLVVARKVAITDSDRFLTIKDIEAELRDGEKGVSGIGAMGQKKIMIY